MASDLYCLLAASRRVGAGMTKDKRTSGRHAARPIILRSVVLSAPESSWPVGRRARPVRAHTANRRRFASANAQPHGACNRTLLNESDVKQFNSHIFFLLKKCFDLYFFAPLIRRRRRQFIYPV